jgi:hypothetical protein
MSIVDQSSVWVRYHGSSAEGYNNLLKSCASTLRLINSGDDEVFPMGNLGQGMVEGSNAWRGLSLESTRQGSDARRC